MQGREVAAGGGQVGAPKRIHQQGSQKDAHKSLNSITAAAAAAVAPAAIAAAIAAAAPFTSKTDGQMGSLARRPTTPASQPAAMAPLVSLEAWNQAWASELAAVHDPMPVTELQLVYTHGGSQPLGALVKNEVLQGRAVLLH